jgi:hypothetical protein
MVPACVTRPRSRFVPFAQFIHCEMRHQVYASCHTGSIHQDFV